METLDLSSYVAQHVTIKLPDGEVTIVLDVSPILNQELLDWFATYRKGMASHKEPNWEQMFQLAARATGIDTDRLKGFGKVLVVRLLDFLLIQWANWLRGLTTNSSSPVSELPPVSTGRSPRKTSSAPRPSSVRQLRPSA